MGKVMEKKKKKKGRPSLLDLQKRNLKEQEEHQEELQRQHQLLQPHNRINSTPLRRSTRRNPNPDETDRDDVNDEEDEQLGGKRREKKLKLVLKLPGQHKISVVEDVNGEEENVALNCKKRKINAIGDGSGFGGDASKGETPSLGTNPVQGSLLDSEPSTPLPDKKLLVFILDRLQKKDTYGVFSEPVDPKELPDYFEVIERPMDFGTLRKKLASGAYASLEQFENDVFLICSNAMQYNAPDTIYFRQARSIHELAEKNFENLRQDSDDNETELKIVRRGRPPTKNLKRPPGRPPLERAVSRFSPDATLATRGENTISSNYDLRKGTSLSEKSGLAHGPRNSDIYTGLLADKNFERNDDYTGSIMKGNSIKNWKKQFVLDENRRNTYSQSYPSSGGREHSVLTTFGAERKQLMAVGPLSEHGYARSLARFAADLGPVAWNIASKKIERCLPPGMKFGPGWVGENDVTPQRPLTPPSLPPGRLSQSKPFIVSGNAFSVATQFSGESEVDKISDKVEGDNSSEMCVASTHPTLDGSSKMPLPPSAGSSSSLFFANKSPETSTGKAESLKGLNSHSGFNIPNSSGDATRQTPPIPIQRSPVVQPGMNGFNGAYGFNLPSQTGKLGIAARPDGYNFQSSQILDPLSRTNTNFFHPPTRDNSTLQDPKGFSLQNPMSELEATRSGPQTRPSWQGLSPQQKPDSEFSHQHKPDLVPPDLNIRFRSPGSPSSSRRVDSTQPDLALQL